MEEVLVKVDELVGVLKLRIRAKEEMERLANLQLGKADAQLKEQARKALELAGREKRVLDKENIILKVEQLQAEEQRVQNAALNLRKEQDAFQKVRVAKERELKELDDTLKMRAKKLAEGETKLDQDKQSYKAAVMTQLAEKGWITAPLPS